ncbi:membrane protein [Sphaerisporangium melleum]|uniref:Membrane protein n=1 Tax=Sphaerisporangium melleum TaxID=321316 RepID=A0A917VIF8_9ACTN|nr:hypothetical protein [Sphaerisporangium melleum]GGK87243.1 membrane protein [Sphaerisporangium melleum]GII72379.1 membrane protein [Sphaerisporangium melleum]
MNAMTVSLLVGAVIVLATVYISWRAGRLDRMHIRLETARAALDAALISRAAVCMELAASRVLDPATSLVLATATHEARTAGPEEREHAESDLSRTIRAVMDQDRFRERLAETPGGATLMADLDTAVTKVIYSRRFYNNAAEVTRYHQRRWLARTLRLAGHTDPPSYFEIDDAEPASFAQRA